MEEKKMEQHQHKNLNHNNERYDLCDGCGVNTAVRGCCKCPISGPVYCYDNCLYNIHNEYLRECYLCKNFFCMAIHINQLKAIWRGFLQFPSSYVCSKCKGSMQAEIEKERCILKPILRPILNPIEQIPKKNISIKKKNRTQMQSVVAVHDNEAVNVQIKTEATNSIDQQDIHVPPPHNNGGKVYDELVIIKKNHSNDIEIMLVPSDTHFTTEVRNLFHSFTIKKNQQLLGAVVGMIQQWKNDNCVFCFKDSLHEIHNHNNPQVCCIWLINI